VEMVREHGRSVVAAPHDLNVSIRSASRFLAYSRDTGDYHYDPSRWIRHEDNIMVDPQLREAVLTAVEEQPELFLDESADAVRVIGEHVNDDVDVCPSTVARVLAHNGYTRKVTERAFISRNEANRLAWVPAQWQVPLRCHVYLDEAHHVGQVAKRRWAWSLRGSRAEYYGASSPGVRTSFSAAMSRNCLLDWVVTRPPPAAIAPPPPRRRPPHVGCGGGARIFSTCPAAVAAKKTPPLRRRPHQQPPRTNRLPAPPCRRLAAAALPPPPRRRTAAAPPTCCAAAAARQRSRRRRRDGYPYCAERGVVPHVRGRRVGRGGGGGGGRKAVTMALSATVRRKGASTVPLK